MLRRHLGSALFFGFAIASTYAIAGCSSVEDSLGANEAADTPAEITGSYALAESCSRLFKRHESVRAIDMQQGIIRWACADVAKVTDSDLGQEYCEYQAVQGGKIKRKASDLDPSQPVSCVFTSVFEDASSGTTSLKSAMSDPANLGVAASDNGIVQMQRSFNTRGAATGLLRDCSGGNSATTTTGRLRMAACYQAVAAGGANAAQLQQLCSSASTLSDAQWAQAQQLGATLANPGDAAYENQHDIAGCMNVRGHGVSWRNSDPMICGRTQRTTTECGCSFSAVPNSLVGFPFTGWVDDQIPSECRLAKVNGQPYPYVAICDLNAKEISDLPLNANYARNIGNFCHDRFSVDLVMKLPLRALSGGSCRSSSPFCSEYMGGAAASAGAPEEAPAAPALQTPVTSTRNDGAPQ